LPNAFIGWVVIGGTAGGAALGPPSDGDDKPGARRL
jgi:hypothetical protein